VRKEVSPVIAIGSRELPKYTVHAHKIQHIRDMGNGTAMITPARNGYDRFPVEMNLLRRWKASIGGFIVLKPDGSLAYASPDLFQDPESEIYDDQAHTG
jgi:hypothetical protein